MCGPLPKKPPLQFYMCYLLSASMHCITHTQQRLSTQASCHVNKMHLMHLFGIEMRAALLCLRELQNKIQMQPADMSFRKKNLPKNQETSIKICGNLATENGPAWVYGWAWWWLCVVVKLLPMWQCVCFQYCCCWLAFWSWWIQECTARGGLDKTDGTLSLAVVRGLAQVQKHQMKKVRLGDSPCSSLEKF